MKISKRQLKRIIREEKHRLLQEQEDSLKQYQQGWNAGQDTDVYGQGDEMDPEMQDLWNQMVQAIGARFPDVNSDYFGDEIYDAIQTEWAAAAKEQDEFNQENRG